MRLPGRTIQLLLILPFPKRESLNAQIRDQRGAGVAVSVLVCLFILYAAEVKFLLSLRLAFRVPPEGATPSHL
jgi:hypothetical protein